MKAARVSLALIAAAALAGCSGASSLSTGSILGGAEKPSDAGPVNDPMARALQVGTISAKAVKCGFNFDPAKLKTSYIAYERNLSGPSADTSKVERIYDVAFNGVAKAVAADAEYCSEDKTRIIKADLKRHLAGDYTPSPRQEEPEEEGLLSWGTDGKKEFKQRLPTDNSD